MSFCTGLKNLHDDNEEVIIVDDIVDDVLLSPTLRLKCKRMLIVACMPVYLIFLYFVPYERRQEKLGGELELKKEKLFVLLSLRKVRKIKKSS